MAEPRHPGKPAAQAARGLLAAGLAWLPLAPALRGEYSDFLHNRNASRQRIAALSALISWGLAILYDAHLVDGALFGWMLLLRLTVMGTAAFYLLRDYPPEHLIFRLGLLLTAVQAAVGVVLGRLANSDYPYEYLLLVCISYYSIAVGVHLGWLLFCQLSMLLIYLGSQAWLGLPATELFNAGLFLLIANLCGVVIAGLQEHNARELFLLTRQLQEQAEVDELTGLLNRRGFVSELKRLWLQAQREHLPLTLLACDVDHFKAYNDHYGHPAGDQVLKALGGVIQQAARRPLDMAVRMGGEEFLVLLYGLDGARAQPHAEALRSDVLGLAIAHAYSSTGPVVSLSIGIASLQPADGGSFDSLLVQADAALYRAKSRGRNQVAC